MSKLRGNSSVANSTSTGNVSTPVPGPVARTNESLLPSTPAPAAGCVWSVPVLLEEVDVLSLRFSPVKGPNVSVSDAQPTLLAYPLPTQATGGTLNLQLTLNTVSAAHSQSRHRLD